MRKRWKERKFSIECWWLYQIRLQFLVLRFLMKISRAANLVYCADSAFVLVQKFFDDDTMISYRWDNWSPTKWMLKLLVTYKSWFWQNQGKETPGRGVVSAWLMWSEYETIWAHTISKATGQCSQYCRMTKLADKGKISIRNLRDKIDTSDFVNFVLWKLNTKNFDL